MEARNWIGLVFMVAGVILQPLGWMFFHPLQIVSFILIFIGAAIFITQKYIEKSEEGEFGSSSRGGTGMPGDIHDHSGWGHGGRSASWNEKSSGDGGDGGGGGGGGD